MGSGCLYPRQPSGHWRIAPTDGWSSSAPRAVDGLCQNVVLRSQSRRFLCLRTPLLRAVFGLSNERAVPLACWIAAIAMVVIGVGHSSYFFPILKRSAGINVTCVAVPGFCAAEHRRGPKMITRVAATVLGVAAPSVIAGLRLVLV